MLTKKKFDDCMRLLSEASGKTFSAPLTSIWFHLFSRYFDDTTLPVVTAKAIMLGRPITMRSLIELHYGSPNELAFYEWTTDTYSDIGKRAITLLGGVSHKENNATNNRMRDHFVELYVSIWETYLADGKELPTKNVKPQSDRIAIEPVSDKGEVASIVKQLELYAKNGKTLSLPSGKVKNGTTLAKRA